MQFPLRLGNPLAQFGDLCLGMPEVRPRRFYPLIGRLGLLEHRAQFRHGRLGCLELGLVLGPPRQFGLDLIQTQSDHLRLGLDGPQPFFDPLLVDRPAVETQDVA